jgi:hypothetical protein
LVRIGGSRTGAHDRGPRAPACRPSHVAGRFDEEELTAQPGIEPVWVRFLHELHLVTRPDDTLNLIDKII